MEDSVGTRARTNTMWLGALLAFGMIAGGWVLGGQIKATRLSDRYVSVRGLAERKVKSDLAVWLITYKDSGDDLPTVYAKAEADKKTIMEFLTQQGVQTSEIEAGIVQVTDTQANEYGANRASKRYIVEQQLTVRTPNVDQVSAAAQKTMILLQKGIVLNSAAGRGLTYKFTSLNSIKPDMITEATRNARAAADRFAADSGSRVGSIRTATQGVFSIAPEDEVAAGEEEGSASFSAESTLMKTVRVVTSVDYYLDR